MVQPSALIAFLVVVLVVVQLSAFIAFLVVVLAVEHVVGGLVEIQHFVFSMEPLLFDTIRLSVESTLGGSSLVITSEGAASTLSDS